MLSSGVNSPLTIEINPAAPEPLVFVFAKRGESSMKKMQMCMNMLDYLEAA